MCNAIKDGNLTGGMSYITIICFSPLAVSHTEKCLTTRDYANFVPARMFCYWQFSFDYH